MDISGKKDNSEKMLLVNKQKQNKKKQRQVGIFCSNILF